MISKVSSAIYALALGFTLLGAASIACAAACTAGSSSALDKTLFNSVGLNPSAGGCTVNTLTAAAPITGNSDQLPVHASAPLLVRGTVTGSQVGGGQDDDHHVVPLPPSIVLLASGALVLLVFTRRRRSATD